MTVKLCGMIKKKDERLEYKVFTRIGKKKYDELLIMLNDSDSRTMSALLRSILQHERITVHTHDTTLNKTMEQLSGIRKELQAIGVNINQATRKLHQTNFNGEELVRAQQILKAFQQTDGKIDMLFETIANLSERWLPK